MEFREIDKSNYWDCIALTVDDSQVDFVADNKQSLVEAAYEDGLYVLGIYNEDTMVGFVLYDYDETFPGWSMSRFMIGEKVRVKSNGMVGEVVMSINRKEEGGEGRADEFVEKYGEVQNG